MGVGDEHGHDQVVADKAKEKWFYSCGLFMMLIFVLVLLILIQVLVVKKGRLTSMN